MAYKWVRIWESILGSSDVMSLSEAMRWRWIGLIILTHCEGEEGILNWSDNKIRRKLRITEEQWQETKKLFSSEECEFIRVLDNGIELINYSKHQRRYDLSTDRVKKYREKHSEVEEQEEVSK